VALGYNHTCVVTTSGAAKCWGSNAYGMLGNVTNTSYTATPVDVVDSEGDPITGIAALTANRYHTCALTDLGGVKCWGLNSSGQLGDGTTDNSSVPVDVVGLDSGVTHLDTGHNYTCAVTSSGAAKCWGYNRYGWLGDGTTSHQSEPVAVIGLESGVKSVHTGRGHTCVVTDSGVTKCWGYNSNGRLGDGTTTQRREPVAVIGLGSGVNSATSSYYHTCALLDSGRVNCWGSNSSGRLGDGTTTNSLTAVEVKQTPPGLPADVTVTVSDDSSSDTVDVSLTVG
jgi:Alpha-tubulin suppressor and related RCC1 domain-containing proteins